MNSASGSSTLNLIHYYWQKHHEANCTRLIVIFSTERDKLSCVMDTSPLSINPSPIPRVVCYVPLTVHQCPFILMGGERHCRDERVLTKNDMAETLGFKGQHAHDQAPSFSSLIDKNLIVVE